MSSTRKPARNNVLNEDTSGPFMEKFGKLPPQATDLEETVLGALMLDRDAMERIAEILPEEAFYKESHQLIYKACKKLFTEGQPIDIVTVTKECRNMGNLDIVGGPYYITSLTNRVGSAAHIEAHARIIAEKHIQRELIRVSTDITRVSYDDGKDVFELLDYAERSLFGIAESSIAKQTEHALTVVSRTIKQIQSIKDHGNGLSGIASGFTGLDRITNGWQDNTLIIIAGRPGMGKTSFALTCMRNAAIYSDKPVAIFSLEMESTELMSRLLSSEAEIDHNKFKSGKLSPNEWETLSKAVNKIGALPIYIDDTPALSMFQLRAKARRLKSQYGVGMIFVDYLQLMRGDENSKAGNREQEISYISRSLKALSKELCIPVMALASMNREVDKRTGSKLPQLSDIRESGSIESDADIVIFVNRPEKNGITEDSEGQSLIGIADVIVAKHRSGPTDTIRLRFKGEFTKFTDLNTFGDSQFVDYTDVPPVEPVHSDNWSRLNRFSPVIN